MVQFGHHCAFQLLKQDESEMMEFLSQDFSFSVFGLRDYADQVAISIEDKLSVLYSFPARKHYCKRLPSFVKL